jgi:hemin uptake protein HemP
MKPATDCDPKPKTPGEAFSDSAKADVVIESALLLQGRDAVRISHGGSLYTLRRTRQDKLILTK